MQSSLNRRLFLKYTGALVAGGSMLTACSKADSEPAPAPSVPLTLDIAAFGDSLTAGTGGTPYPTQLATALGRTVKTYGIGGQQAEQIAARQGGVPINITLTGNAFNGAEAVKVIVPSMFLSTSADNSTRSMAGTVAGVKCTITRTATGTAPTQVESYTIKPLAASTTAVPTGSTFIPDDSVTTKDFIQALWMGRNNSPDFASLPGLIASCVAHINDPKRFIVIGVLNATIEPEGSAKYKAIEAINATLKKTYPTQFVASTPPTEAELAALNYSPTVQDKEDITWGMIPTGMRYDKIHLNSIGYHLIANRVQAKLKELGY